MNRAATGLALIACALSSLAQQKPLPATPHAPPAQDSQLYRNRTFAFTYSIPYGWVERTREMQEQETSNKSQANGGAPKGEVLLAVFERPPQAAGDTINSAVVIATENSAAYPGLKKAEDYLGPLTELIAAKGFKVGGNPSVIEIDARQLVRADFSKPLNDKLTMHQTTLILLAKAQILSFTFISGSEDELDDLIEGLHFGAPKPPAH